MFDCPKCGGYPPDACDCFVAREPIEGKAFTAGYQALQAENTRLAARVEELEGELAIEKYITGRFEDWHSEECPHQVNEECPHQVNEECPHEEEAREAYDKMKATGLYAEAWEFDPQDSCGREDCSGECWVETYRRAAKAKTLLQEAVTDE